jgi:hypothetical protein
MSAPTAPKLVAFREEILAVQHACSYMELQGWLGYGCADSSTCHILSGAAARAHLPHAIIHSVQIMHVKGRVGVRLSEHILRQLHPCVITHHNLRTCGAWQMVFDALVTQRTPCS